MQTSTHEYYGFTLYLTSLTLFGTFDLSISYQTPTNGNYSATYILVSLAHKPYWAIAIPCYAMTIYPFLLTVFIAVNMLHTPSLHEAATFTGTPTFSFS